MHVVSGFLQIFSPAGKGVVSLFQTTTLDGKRCSTYHAFLKGEPSQRANLRIVTEAHVTRVLFEEVDGQATAVGVEYRDAAGQLQSLFATKEVVLSAGAIGSPHLLMLSGIGPRAELEAVGVRCRVDAPRSRRPPGSNSRQQDLRRSLGQGRLVRAHAQGRRDRHERVLACSEDPLRTRCLYAP